ncbi:MAG: hypothetical protein ACOYT8_01530 [Candidatus Dependentiae bacterium]
MKLKLIMFSLFTLIAFPACALRINEGEFEELVHEFRRAKAAGDWAKARDVVQEMEDQGANDWDTQRFRMELNCTTYQPEPCYGAYPRRICPGDCD